MIPSLTIPVLEIAIGSPELWAISIAVVSRCSASTS